MSDTVLRPEIVQTPRGAQDFGVIEKPLTVFERLYNQVWLRKLFLIAVLIVLMGYYTCVSLTMNFYDVPAGTPGLAR